VNASQRLALGGYPPSPEVFISLKPEPLRLVSGWVHEYERFWTQRLDRLEQHFKDERLKKEKKR